MVGDWWRRELLQGLHCGCGVLFVLLFCGGQVLADVLRLENLKPNSVATSGPLCGLETLEGWVYQQGDDPLWASPVFDDGHWAPLPAKTDAMWHMPTGIVWTGMAWFRVHLRFHSEIVDKELALLLFHSGAIEVFVDGKLVHKDGKIENGRLVELGEPVLADLPRVISLEPVGNRDVVIAVRYATQDIHDAIHLGLPTWWGLALSPFEDAYLLRDQRIRQQSILQMLAGVPLVFAMLHLLFFLFYRRAKGNLYYAILAGWTAVLIYVPMYFPFAPHHLEFLLNVTKVGLIGAILAGLKFYYYEFFNRMPRYWHLIFWPSVVLCAFSWMLSFQIVCVIAFLGFPELIRIVLKAVYQNKSGAWLVGVGLSVFVITCTYQILIELNVFDRTASYFYVYGILCLILSMSVYLAYTFGAAGKQLESQVLEVQRLSEQNIKQSQLAREQEREKREREIARQILETENRLQTMELEEAQKRQKILDDLAQSNKDLHQTQVQLIQAEKMASLGSLVAGIAHEINTPVGAINSMHDTLVRAVAKLEVELDKKLPQEHPARRVITASFQVIGEANRVIATGTERVRDIVRSLRNFARLDEADWKRVDLHEGIESTLALVQHDLKNRIELIKDYGTIPLVECFPGRLNQVFLNLLVNAAQAIDGNGQITIRTWQEEDQVYVMFRDTGKGISSENVPRIFESGFTTKKAGMGTGLGLSICAQIVSTHQGEILVESEVGKGSTFTVVLPVVQHGKEDTLK